MKRDKGIFYRDGIKLPRTLEQELDNIVKQANQENDERLKIINGLQNQISEIQTKGTGATLTSSVAYNEYVFYGGENITIKKDFSTANVSLTSLQSGDEIEEIMIKVKTPDTGVTDFKINDGTNDLANIGDIDFSQVSVQTPANSVSVEYTSSASLNLYIGGATTLTGWVKVKIFRKAVVQQGIKEQGFLQ